MWLNRGRVAEILPVLRESLKERPMLFNFNISIRAMIGSALAVLLATTVHSQAPDPSQYLDPPVRMTDANDVDMFSLQTTLSIPLISIGSRERPFTYSFESSANGAVGFPVAAGPLYRNNYNGRLIYESNNLQAAITCDPVGSHTPIVVELNGANEVFCDFGTHITSVKNRGTHLEGHQNGHLYTDNQGNQYYFEGQLRQIRYTNGLTVDIIPHSPSTLFHIERVVRNDGLSLDFTYTSGSAPNAWPLATTRHQTGVRAMNLAYEYCAPTAVDCGVSQTWRLAQFSWHLGTNAAQRILELRRPSGARARLRYYQEQNPDPSQADAPPYMVGYSALGSTGLESSTYEHCPMFMIVDRCMSGSSSGGPRNGPGGGAGGGVIGPGNFGMVRGATLFGETYIYAANSGYANTALSILDTYSEDSNGLRTTSQTISYTDGRTRILNIIQPDGTGYYWADDHENRLSHIAHADGTTTRYTYDARGNVIEERREPISTSSMADIVRTASYPVNCTNRVICNKPVSTTDGNGNTTDYTYDPVHGGLLSITGPAVEGVRPQTRYTYVQRYARIRTSSGGYTNASSPIWVMATQSYCRNSAWTGSVCAGGDEVVTSYDYGPSGGATPNNLWVRSITVTAGGQSRRTCMTYDRFGHLLTETEPAGALSACPT